MSCHGFALLEKLSLYMLVVTSSFWLFCDQKALNKSNTYVTARVKSLKNKKANFILATLFVFSFSQLPRNGDIVWRSEIQSC